LSNETIRISERGGARGGEQIDGVARTAGGKSRDENRESRERGDHRESREKKRERKRESRELWNNAEAEKPESRSSEGEQSAVAGGAGGGDRVMTRRETAGEGEYVPAQRLRTPWRWPPGPCTPVDRPRRPQLRIDLGSLSHP
jgi:hypothetical protein